MGKIALGAVFLFNPTVNIVDILPDFIGYWLIVLGLSALSSLSEEIYVARKNFIYLVAICASKVVCSLFIPFASETFTVTAALIFSVSEAVFFIPAMSGFLESMSSFGLRYGNNAGFYVPVSRRKLAKAEKIASSLERMEVSDKKAEKKKASLEKKRRALVKPMTAGGLKVLTVIAFIVRALGYILPELPSLSMQNITYFPAAGAFNVQLFKAPLYVLVWICGLSVCIPWLVIFLRYINGIRNEEQFITAVYDKYEKDILSDTKRLIAERMKKVMILAVAAAFTTFYIPIDNVNVLPGFLTAGFLIAAFVYIRVYNKRAAYTGIAVCGLWAAVSVCSLFLQMDYVANNYKPASAFHEVGKSVVLYARMEYFSFAEAILFAAAALIFARVFIGALKSHIGLLSEARVSYMGGEKKYFACLKPVAILGGIVIVLSSVLVFVTKFFAGAWLIYGGFVIAFFILTLLAYFKTDDRVYLSLRRKF